VKMCKLCGNEDSDHVGRRQSICSVATTEKSYDRNVRTAVVKFNFQLHNALAHKHSKDFVVKYRACDICSVNTCNRCCICHLCFLCCFLDDCPFISIIVWWPM